MIKHAPLLSWTCAVLCHLAGLSGTAAMSVAATGTDMWKLLRTGVIHTQWVTNKYDDYFVAVCWEHGDGNYVRQSCRYPGDQ